MTTNEKTPALAAATIAAGPLTTQAIDLRRRIVDLEREAERFAMEVKPVTERAREVFDWEKEVTGDIRLMLNTADLLSWIITRLDDHERSKGAATSRIPQQESTSDPAHGAEGEESPQPATAVPPAASEPEAAQVRRHEGVTIGPLYADAIKLRRMLADAEHLAEALFKRCPLKHFSTNPEPAEIVDALGDFHAALGIIEADIDRHERANPVPASDARAESSEPAPRGASPTRAIALGPLAWKALDLRRRTAAVREELQSLTKDANLAGADFSGSNDADSGLGDALSLLDELIGPCDEADGAGTSEAA